MVNLLEHEGKALFKKYSISIPNGVIVRSNTDIKKSNFPAVLKAQVPTGHRGKSGGVKIVKNAAEAREQLKTMREMSFEGFTPKAFLLEDLVKHVSELYLSISLDRSKRSPVLIASTEGGIDIESVQKNKIFVFTLNQLEGVPDYVKQEIFEKLGLRASAKEVFFKLISNMWSIYKQEDAELVEINPLAVSGDDLIALDSKIIIDDDALFRHPEIKPDFGTDPLEIEAKKKGISFVRLGGDIGIIANGAGLTMSTIDQIALLGGKPGDFLDLGGTDNPARVVQALSLVYEFKPSVLFINVFGGVTKADTVAEGIISAVKERKPPFKIIVRLRGFNEEIGRQLLKENGIEAFTDMTQAIAAAVAESKR